MIQLRYPQTNLIAIMCTDNENTDFYVMEIGYSSPPPGFKVKASSNDYVIHFVSDGCGLFNGEYIDKRKGFCIAPNEQFEYIFDTEMPWRHYWIRLGGKNVVSVLKSLGMKTDNHVFEYDRFDELIDDYNMIIDGKLNAEKPSCWMMSMFYRTMAYYGSIESRKSKSQSEQYIEMAKRYIERNYMNPITVMDIAQEVKISSKYLYRIFLKNTGQSLKAYLIEYRISVAKELLKCTNYSIKEIAELVGYEQAEYFSASFSKKTGVSPFVYRSNVR